MNYGKEDKLENVLEDQMENESDKEVADPEYAVEKKIGRWLLRHSYL